MATSTSPLKKDQPAPSGGAGQKPTLAEVAAEAVPSFKSLVTACNNFTDGFDLPADHAYLCLPDSKKTFKIFGILQPGVLDTIKWDEHDFVVTTVEAARKAGAAIPEQITKGKVVMPEGLEPKEITQRFEDINNRYTMVKGTKDKEIEDKYALRGLKGKSDKARVPLVGGHRDIKFPDKLGVYLGVLQIGVHLTVYHVDKDKNTNIYVQHRSGTASYPKMLDQTIAGGLQHNESVRGGLDRENKEEGDCTLQALDVSEATYEGSVVFSMTRPKEANKLKETLEISTKACFSLRSEEKLEPGAKSQDSNVESFEWMSVAGVLEALKNQRFKPNCALVMIKFLIDHGLVDTNDAVVQEAKKNLTRKIVFYLPEDLENYETP